MPQSISNLPVGAKVKFGKHSVRGETAWDIPWLIVAKNHQCTPAYPTNSVTLCAEQIIDLRCLDAREPKSSRYDQTWYGLNRYSLSNIHTWLNSRAAANAWYTAKHDVDQSPDSESNGETTEPNGVVLHGTQYANRPGFLNLFSNAEYNAILNTTIRVNLTITDTIGEGEYEDITAKVFLPSEAETGLDSAERPREGYRWEYHSSESSNRVRTVHPMAYAYTLSDSKPASAGERWTWWVRTPYKTTNGAYAHQSTGSYSLTYTLPYDGSVGVVPALNIASSTRVSDTTDSEGYYTMVWNVAPTAPTTLNVPTTIYGGKTASISWGAASDVDGGTLTYLLECSLGGGAFTQIYAGTSRSYTHSVPKGTTTVQYRVRARDTSNAYSSYTTSASRTVINNDAPVVSGTDSNLGTKSAGFDVTYSVSDANSDSVTVVEAIDGVRVRSYVVTLGKTNTFSVTNETWLTLSNGTHTMTITATDPIGESAVRSYTFVKSVTSFSVQTNAMVAGSMPTRISISITRSIPTGATFKVEVCNNAKDASPKWEDATSSVQNGLVHLFTNTSKTADSWAVALRVTVNRGSGEGACYISGIGGNFE